MYIYMYMPEELEHYGSQESQDVNTPVSTVLKLFLLSLLLHIVYFQQLHLVLVMGGSMGLLQVLFHQLFHRHTHTRIHRVITLDILQTSATSIRWQKWFPGTGQIIIVTSQMHSHSCYF